MALGRRQSNGRSPLVNQQRQITSFFTKSSSSPSPSPSPGISKPESKLKPKPNPNPNSTPNVSPSPSPTTPSPLQSKPKKKPLLVIGHSPSPPTPTPALDIAVLYGDEVVNRRIRVYWPLDETWYEGCVKSFDKMSGKHLVQYDDTEQELLDFAKEKIELVKKEQVKRFRRLRRFSIKEEEEAEEDKVEDVESGGDDSMDEDWGENVEKEAVVDDEMEDLDLDDEEEDGALSAKSSEKRKLSAKTKSGSVKKTKNVADIKKSACKVTLDVNAGTCVQPTKNNNCK